MRSVTNWLYIIGSLCFLFGTIWTMATAQAHSWYPANCCSNQDCKAVPREDLEEQPEGTWKYLPNGAVFTKKQTHPSQDKDWHVCYQDASVYDDSGQTPPDTPIPMCVFIQMGF